VERVKEKKRREDENYFEGKASGSAEACTIGWVVLALVYE
jgi:hypothetical protein